MQRLIENEAKANNILKFPSSEYKTVAVLDRSEPTDKFIKLYDIRREGFYRRVTKKHMDSEVMALDTNGRMLAYVDGPDLIVRLIRIPHCSLLIDTLRPRY